MSDPYRSPPQALVEVRLVSCTGDSFPAAAAELQDLMSQGFVIETHAGGRSGEYGTRWLWTLSRRTL